MALSTYGRVGHRPVRLLAIHYTEPRKRQDTLTVETTIDTCGVACRGPQVTPLIVTFSSIAVIIISGTETASGREVAVHITRKLVMAKTLLRVKPTRCRTLHITAQLTVTNVHRLFIETFVSKQGRNPVVTRGISYPP